MGSDRYVFRERSAQPGAPLVFAFHGTGGDETQFFDLRATGYGRRRASSRRAAMSRKTAPLRFFHRKARGRLRLRGSRLRRRSDGGVRRARTSSASTPVGRRRSAIPTAPTFSRRSRSATRICSTNVVLMHPLIPWAPPDDTPISRGLRVLITAGRRDPICPPSLTIALADYFARHGTTVELEWHDGGHELRPSGIGAVSRWNPAGGLRRPSTRPAPLRSSPAASSRPPPASAVPAHDARHSGRRAG